MQNVAQSHEARIFTPPRRQSSGKPWNESSTCGARSPACSLLAKFLTRGISWKRFVLHISRSRCNDAARSTMRSRGPLVRWDGLLGSKSLSKRRDTLRSGFQLLSSKESGSSDSVDSMALRNETRPVPEFVVDSLLSSPVITIRDTYCRGTCRHQSAEECTTTTQLVFPYRGVYVRHVGVDQAVAEANQVLFFNAFEGYRIIHPVPGGDASLTLVISEAMLRELAPRTLMRDGANLLFRQPR